MYPPKMCTPKVCPPKMYPPKMYSPNKKPSKGRRSVTPKRPHPKPFSSDDPARSAGQRPARALFYKICFLPWYNPKILCILTAEQIRFMKHVCFFVIYCMFSSTKYEMRLIFILSNLFKMEVWSNLNTYFTPTKMRISGPSWRCFNLILCTNKFNQKQEFFLLTPKRRNSSPIIPLLWKTLCINTERTLSKIPLFNYQLWCIR